MNKRIQVSVADKIATKNCDTVYVCGNSDYVVDFVFDAEWDAYPVKTARFVPGNGQKPIDMVFEGNSCEVPVISDTMRFNVGVYVGDLHTTTPAVVPCKASILCGSGSPKEPAPDVYAQIMEKLNNMSGGVTQEDIEQAIEAYMQEHPATVNETDPTVPGWAKRPNKPTYTAEEVGAADKEETAQALNSLTEDIAALGGKCELIETITITDEETRIIERTQTPEGQPYFYKKNPAQNVLQSVRD